MGYALQFCSIQLSKFQTRLFVPQLNPIKSNVVTLVLVLVMELWSGKLYLCTIKISIIALLKLF